MLADVDVALGLGLRVLKQVQRWAMGGSGIGRLGDWALGVVNGKEGQGVCPIDAPFEKAEKKKRTKGCAGREERARVPAASYGGPWSLVRGVAEETRRA